MRPIRLGEHDATANDARTTLRTGLSDPDDIENKRDLKPHLFVPMVGSIGCVDSLATATSSICVVSGGVGEIARSTSLRLKKVNTSALHCPNNQLGK